jgi:surface carbohydrate biosynthesis protein
MTSSDMSDKIALPKKWPLLFLPIETKVREFQAKLLLSCYAAEAGFEVIIGEQVELSRRVKRMAFGIYIEKGLTPPKLENITQLHAVGHIPVAWCEEGLVMFNREAYARDRVYEDVLSKLSLFLAWGNAQTEALQMKVPDVMKKVVVTGNPRFDLLRLPYRSVFFPAAERIRERFGRFLLINTNFGVYNNFFGSRFFISEMMERYGRIIDEEHRKFFDGLIAHVESTYRYFVQMVSRLSREFPEYKIVVRPHPSENHRAWKEEMAGLPNALVVHEGTAIPWILASQMVIHNTCTTAVEAFILEKPVVAYRPVVSEAYDPELPRIVSVCVSSEDELVNTLGRILQDNKPIENNDFHAPEYQRLLENYAESLKGTFACEKIVSALIDLADKADGGDRLLSTPLFHQMRESLKDYAFDLRVLGNRLRKRGASDSAYHAQKFPGLSMREIEEGIDSFRRVSRRFGAIKIEKVKRSRACFRIFSEANH